ncbi:MAG TPA: methyltransferase domain-containing protein [Polyangia bacterium]|nr:methyltransferase domain-containing protein [Polyangia bacterium]
MTAEPGALVEKTIPGLHEAVVEILRARLGRKPARIADLGAGSGAWAARLLSEGHLVYAVERDRAFFELRTLQPIVADLDQPFAHLVPNGLDAVTAIEVIEHLENPRHFLRECRKLLAPDGLLLLTTPNVECVPGRLRFLASGQLRHFDRDPSFNDPTHITPIQSYLFERMASDCGFRIEHHGFNRPTPTIGKGLVRLVSALLSPLLRGITGGDNHVFVLRPL